MIRTAEDLITAKSDGILCNACTLEVASICKRVGCAEETITGRGVGDSQRVTGRSRPTPVGPRPVAGSKAPSATWGAIRVLLYWAVFSALGSVITAGIGTALLMVASRH